MRPTGELRKPPPPPGPSSPQVVLQNLVLAYNSRDSLETKLLYDAQYQGTSTTASLVVSTFTKADEVAHVKHLHDDPNIINVMLDLGPASTWQRMPGQASDPPGWAVIPVTYHLVRISDIASGSLYETGPSQMEFTFKPTVTSPGDTTWTVVRWTEVAN